MRPLLYIPLVLGLFLVAVVHGVIFLLSMLMALLCEGVEWCDRKARGR